MDLHASSFRWQPIPGNGSDTIEEVIGLQSGEMGIDFENILRWEDDGGSGSEAINVLPQVVENKTPRMMDTFRRHLV